MMIDKGGWGDGGVEKFHQRHCNIGTSATGTVASSSLAGREGCRWWSPSNKKFGVAMTPRQLLIAWLLGEAALTAFQSWLEPTCED